MTLNWWYKNSARTKFSRKSHVAIISRTTLLYRKTPVILKNTYELVVTSDWLLDPYHKEMVLHAFGIRLWHV